METNVPTHYTRRETFYIHNTLLSLIKGLEKRYVTIDLRNETSVTGKIVEVDGFMNVTLTEAAVFDTDDEYRYFPIMYIQSRNIRNVIIPDNVNVIKTIKSIVIKESKKQTKGQRTFKQSRALKQQKETLKLVKEMKEKKAGKKDEKGHDVEK